MTSLAVKSPRPPVRTSLEDRLSSGGAILVATDFVLDQMVASLAAHDGDLLSALIVAALGSGNCAHLPVTRFAALEDIPPDQERRPLTVRQVADSLGQPYETVRRRFVALEAAGQVARRGRNGFIVPEANDRAPDRLEATRRTHGKIQRMVKALHALEGC